MVVSSILPVANSKMVYFFFYLSIEQKKLSADALIIHMLTSLNQDVVSSIYLKKIKLRIVFDSNNNW